MSAMASPPVRVSELPEELVEVSSWRGFFHVGRTWLAILLVVAVCGRQGSVLAALVGIVLISGLQNSLLVLWHHSTHRNLHPSARLNDAVARWLLISPMGQPFGIMHRAHLTHHAHLGELEDPDRWYYDLDLHGRRRGWVLVSWLVVNSLGGLLVPQIRKAWTGRRDAHADPGTERAARDRRDRLAVLVSQALLFLLFFAIGGSPWAYVVFWAVPVVTLGGGLNCLRTALEHADANRPPHLNYSFDSNPVERFFVAPLQMNLHWEHHVLMTVPYYHLPGLRRHLQERGIYGEGRIVGTYIGHLRRVLEDLRRPAPDTP